MGAEHRIHNFIVHPAWQHVKKKLLTSKRIIDLGCGTNPVAAASVAIDPYINPIQRSCKSGTRIKKSIFNKSGIKFIQSRIDVNLPFENKAFDFAYCRHVVEHLKNPAKACEEMMRIAKEGVVICPSIFAEQLFGRSYHKWLVMDRKNLLLFFKKRLHEDRPFGKHPNWDKSNMNWIAEKDTNPFDILLNDGGWYKGKEKMPRLSSILKKYWCTHSPVLELVFFWKNRFNYIVYK
ncbi:MAG: class I SAM-dependent methyltransferase [Candidatus Omnitrophota bacterium]